MKLSPEHLKMLRDESGISDAVIEARGYQTITKASELHQRDFSRQQSQVPGLLLPVHTTDGGNSLYEYRPDIPRVVVDKKRRNPDVTFKNHIIKYEHPKGMGIRLDCPPVCRPMLGDPSIHLWITEGIKKGDALASHALCVIVLLGVWNFKGKNEFDAVTILADWDYVALKGREVCIVFDSDVMQKAGVRKALDRLTEHLQRKCARVRAIYLPAANGEKVGVDDYLLQHSVADLEALIDTPKPQVKPAPPLIELLDAPPSVIRKPLSLIDGRAFAAIFPYIQVTTTETLDKEGNIIRLNEPLTETEQRVLIIRDDGKLFGEGGDEPTEGLGITVRLNEIPPVNRQWSTTGVKGYRSGSRINPVDHFNKIADIVDRFIDFDRSLAPQRVMCEMVACYTLSTWFLDAFNVIGFLWPNGERGSGKTQLLTICAELSYLGQLILAGGSYASLRDLADYGATLCFDDAENLSDPKQTDSDKRALLLAGNRRGNTVPIKELAPDKTWRTRHVNTFCPRLFSAINLPDPVLASRSIIVPLIRTADRYKANADPLEFNLWAHDRRELVDGLWSMALAHLPELPAFEAYANQHARLAGRNLEPFRGLLAVAAWLEEKGATELWKRMEQLSVDYQKERQNFESADITVLVVRAICQCLKPEIENDPVKLVRFVKLFSDTSKIFIKTTEITEAAKSIAENQEVGVDAERVTVRRIGRILGKLRLSNAREGGTGKAGWDISEMDAKRFAIVYGLIPSETNLTNLTNFTNVTNGVQATASPERELFEI